MGFKFSESSRTMPDDETDKPACFNDLPDAHGRHQHHPTSHTSKSRSSRSVSWRDVLHTFLSCLLTSMSWFVYHLRWMIRGALGALDGADTLLTCAHEEHNRRSGIGPKRVTSATDRPNSPQSNEDVQNKAGDTLMFGLLRVLSWPLRYLHGLQLLGFERFNPEKGCVIVFPSTVSRLEQLLIISAIHTQTGFPVRLATDSGSYFDLLSFLFRPRWYCATYHAAQLLQSGGIIGVSFPRHIISLPIYAPASAENIRTKKVDCKLRRVSSFDTAYVEPEDIVLAAELRRAQSDIYLCHVIYHDGAVRGTLLSAIWLLINAFAAPIWVVAKTLGGQTDRWMWRGMRIFLPVPITCVLGDHIRWFGGDSPESLVRLCRSRLEPPVSPKHHEIRHPNQSSYNESGTTTPPLRTIPRQVQVTSPDLRSPSPTLLHEYNPTAKPRQRASSCGPITRHHQHSTTTMTTTLSTSSRDCQSPSSSSSMALAKRSPSQQNFATLLSAYQEQQQKQTKGEEAHEVPEKEESSSPDPAAKNQIVISRSNSPSRSPSLTSSSVVSSTSRFGELMTRLRANFPIVPSVQTSATFGPGRTTVDVAVGVDADIDVAHPKAPRSMLRMRVGVDVDVEVDVDLGVAFERKLIHHSSKSASLEGEDASPREENNNNATELTESQTHPPLPQHHHPRTGRTRATQRRQQKRLHRHSTTTTTTTTTMSYPEPTSPDDTRDDE